MSNPYTPNQQPTPPMGVPGASPMPSRKTPYVKLQVVALTLAGLAVCCFVLGVLMVLFSQVDSDQSFGAGMATGSLDFFIGSAILWLLTDLGQRAYNKGLIGES